jgi:hypothetical protein
MLRNKDKDIILRNRTNNALERYNRHFAELLKVKHPHPKVLINAIREEGKHWSTRLKNIKSRFEKIPKVENVVPYHIPEDYHSFKNKLISSQKANK